MTNLLGQKIKDFQLDQSQSELTFNFDALQIKSGIYVIQVLTGNTRSTYKIIYQND